MTTNELLYSVMIKNEPKRPCIFTRNHRIDLALQQVTGFHPDDLSDKDRRFELTEPRQIGMYFYWKGGYSLNVSGLRFNRDHATVIHAKRKIEMYYGQKGEQKLTAMINEMSRITGIKPEIITEHKL